jgi:hypothetical protein
MTPRQLNVVHESFWSRVSYDSKAKPVVRPDPPKISPLLRDHSHGWWMRATPVTDAQRTINNKRRYPK